MPKELADFKRDFETYLTQSYESRLQAARDRDYVDHIQWTAEQEAELKKRNQAPIVINRLKVKVNTLCGAERRQREDPRALPRTPEHDGAADAATDGLRYVADNVDFDATASEAFEDFVVWGTEAAITEVKGRGNEIEIGINRIEADRFYYDPHSRRKDFSDAKYMGISVWMDLEDAESEFDVKAEDLAALSENANDSVDGSTFDDQPRWFDSRRKRLRVNQHYYKEKGVWFLCYFTDSLFLIEPQESPFQDEFGQPSNPIEAQSAYIDREGNRYGEARASIWSQDEVNHRRSKALHMLSVRQTVGDPNAVKDLNAMKAALADPNGHIELAAPGARFEILENGDLTQGQLGLYQDAKSELDSGGANAALSGQTDRQLSGTAIQSLQQGGLTELAALFDGHKSWKRRIYRQMWNRIRQFWDEEKWIRVTDDEKKLKWVGLNQPVTIGQKLQEAAQQGDERAVAVLQEMMRTQDPRLNEVAEVKNNVAELDMDIILTETPDVVTVRQEQFKILSQLAQTYGPEKVPFEAMVKLSDIQNKDQIEELLKGEPLPPEVEAKQQQETEEAKQLLKAEKEAEIRGKVAKATKDEADAEEQQIENEAALVGMLPIGELNA